MTVFPEQIFRKLPHWFHKVYHGVSKVYHGRKWGFSANKRSLSSGRNILECLERWIKVSKSWVKGPVWKKEECCPFLWALKIVQRGSGPRQERSFCSCLLWTVNLSVIHQIFAEHLLCVRPWEYSRECFPLLSLPGYASFLGIFLPLVGETTRVLKDIHWLCCPPRILLGWILTLRNTSDFI